MKCLLAAVVLCATALAVLAEGPSGQPIDVKAVNNLAIPAEVASARVGHAAYYAPQQRVFRPYPVRRQSLSPAQRITGMFRNFGSMLTNMRRAASDRMNKGIRNLLRRRRIFRQRAQARLQNAQAKLGGIFRGKNRRRFRQPIRPVYQPQF